MYLIFTDFSVAVFINNSPNNLIVAVLPVAFFPAIRILREIELEEISQLNLDIEYLWHQVGVIHTILDLTLDDSWWVNRALPEPYFSILEKRRKILT